MQVIKSLKILIINSRITFHNKLNTNQALKIENNSISIKAVFNFKNKKIGKEEINNHLQIICSQNNNMMLIRRITTDLKPL